MSDDLGPELLFIYGVVERARNMLNSDVFKEFQTQSPDLFLKDELQELKRIFSDIYLAFPTPYERTHVSFQLGELRNTAYEIEDMMDETTTEQLEQKVYMLRPPDLRLKVKAIVGKLKDIRRRAPSAEKKIRYIHPSLLFNTTKPTGASSHYDRLWCWEDTVVGRGLQKKQILNWILNPSSKEHPNIITVSGYGRTTMAKLIYNDVLVSTTFDLLLWGTVSSSPHYRLDLKSVIVEILRSFNHHSWLCPLIMMDEEKLKDRLRHVLEGKKYLLILDDFSYTTRQWEALRELWELLKVGSMGSTFILNIYSSEVIEDMGCANNLVLNDLSGNDCWSLFTKCSGFDEEAEKEYPFLKDIGKSIVNKCQGNPLAITTMGSMLCNNRDEAMWKQIHESTIWTEPNIPYATSSISFQSMPCDLVECFFLASVLLYKNKAAFSLSWDQLVYFWMAEGLLYSSEGKEEDLRDIGHRYCVQLLLRSFLRSYQCDGHNILSVNKALKYLFIRIETEEIGDLPTAYYLRNRRHLIWNGNQKSLEKGFAPHHQSTLPGAKTFLFHNYVGPVSKTFLAGLISKLSHVRVLLLDGSEFEELPESIGNLKLLRYLSLAGNREIQVLPESICKLLNLQTLDLSGCEQLETLPKEMDTLPSLRHLFLSMKLTNIPEEALKSWRSLHHLKVCSSPNLKSISEGIEHLATLRVLQIHDCPLIASLPNNIKLLTCLKELTILNCQMLDLARWEGLYHLRCLQFLQFQGLPKLIKFPGGLLSAADSLQHLIVRNCGNLTALPELLQTYNNLREIVIESCPNIVSLPKEIYAIKTLQVLKIGSFSKSVPRFQSEDWRYVSPIPKIQLQHQVVQNRATSELKERPGTSVEKRRVSKKKKSREKKFSGPEAEKQAECSSANKSFQEELPMLPEMEFGVLERESSTSGQTKLLGQTELL